MTVTTTYTPVTATGDGSTAAFAFPYLVYQSSHLSITIDGVATADWSAATYGDAAGVTVTFDTAPTNGAVVIIRRIVPYTQSTDLENFDGNPADVTEKQFDLLAMADQQIAEEVDRSIKLSIESALSDIELPVPEANTALTWDALGTSLVNGATVTEIENAEANAVAAAASAAAASTSEGNASTSETNAAASAVAALAALESAPFRDTITLTNADSPYTVLTTQSGFFFSLDTSGGNIVLNLPQISSLTLPFNQRLKKETADANTVTVNVFAGDEFGDGTTSKTIATVGGLDIIAENDTTPDSWKTALFGASAGNMSVDAFVDGVDFTSGTTTFLTLSANAGAENNLWVTFDGVAQHKSEFNLSGTTLTFTSAIPLGVTNVDVQYGTTLAIGTPSDTSVTFAKMASSAIANQAEAEAGTATNKLMTPEQTSQAIVALGGVTITDSAVATPVANTIITIANPLGEIVKYAKVMYRAKTTDWGMTIGQEFDCSLNEAGSTYYGFTLDTSDVTNFKLYAASLGAIRAPDNTNRLITAANIDIFVRCIT